MPISLHPDSDKKPLLPAGRYGLGGEAELTRIALRKAGDVHYISFNCQIDDPSQGRVFADSAAYGQHNTQVGPGAASLAKTLLANLGLNPAEVTFADEADENGNHALLGPNPCPCKVVVDLVVQTNRKTGEERNQLANIGRLA